MVTLKLGLGAVQFGLPYGTSLQDAVEYNEIEKILDLAWQSRISMIDTSSSYGESEEVLGRLTGDNFFQIVSKTPSFRKKSITKSDAKYLYETCLNSLRKLRRSKLYALLIHWPDDLLVSGGTYLFDVMEALKAEGKVEKIGVSVYEPGQLQEIENRFPIEIVQLPLNIFDQRFLKAGALQRLSSKGIEIHIRSIFLLGVLLKNHNELQGKFDAFYELFDKYKKLLAQISLSPLEASLGFVKSIPKIDTMLIGVRSVSQLKDILSAYEKVSVNYQIFESLACTDPLLIDPRNW